jgi:hypothetical protein
MGGTSPRIKARSDIINDTVHAGFIINNKMTLLFQETEGASHNCGGTVRQVRGLTSKVIPFDKNVISGKYNSVVILKGEPTLVYIMFGYFCNTNYM